MSWLPQTLAEVLGTILSLSAIIGGVVAGIVRWRKKAMTLAIRAYDEQQHDIQLRDQVKNLLSQARDHESRIQALERR